MQVKCIFFFNMWEPLPALSKGEGSKLPFQVCSFGEDLVKVHIIYQIMIS